MGKKIYKSTSIFTSECDKPFSGVVLVENDKIAFVGPESEVPACDGIESVEDLGDRTITPGLIDCHVHAFPGLRMEQFNSCFLSPEYNEEELIAAINQFIADNPQPINDMYYFFDYDFDNSGRFTKYRLDEVFGRDKAIMLTDLSLHGGAFSSKALELLEYDGVIPEGSNVQYEEDGTVGYWCEEAFFVLHTRAMTLGGSVNDDETIDLIQKLFNSNGITSIGEMRPFGKSTDYVWAEERYLEREKEGSLTLRVGVCSSLPAEKETWIEDQKKFQGDYLFFNALKGFMDGGFINATAWTTGDWVFGPNKGKKIGPANDMEVYARKIKEANDLGIGVRLHAEGDLAIEKAISMFAQSDNKDVLNQIEHGTLMTDDTLAAIEKYIHDGRKLSINMQPAFLYNEAPTEEHPVACGNEFYNRGAVRVKSAMATGAVVSVGSTDFPVTQPIPRDHIRMEVNRLADEEGSVFYRKGYTPHEAICLSDAIIGSTHNAAIALGRGHDLGLLKEGYKADITIFDQDLFAMDPYDYKKIDIYKTIVNGKEVFCK